MIDVNNIFLIGPMGAGKSTIGKLLAQELKFDFYDSDQVVEQRTGADIAWIFEIEGEEGFRIRERDVIDELSKKSQIVVATGGGAATYPETRRIIASRGTAVLLNISLDEQCERLRNDTRRPLLQGTDIVTKLRELYAERQTIYEELADLSFITDQRAAKSVANEILAAVYPKG